MPFGCLGVYDSLVSSVPSSLCGLKQISAYPGVLVSQWWETWEVLESVSLEIDGEMTGDSSGTQRMLSKRELLCAIPERSGYSLSFLLKLGKSGTGQ